MILDQAVITNKGLMLSAVLESNLFSVSLTKDLRFLQSFFNYLFGMLIWGKFDCFLIILRCTVIKVTERAIKFSSDDNFLALTFHHEVFDTLSAGSFIATLQENRLSLLEIKEMLADGAFEVRILGLLHTI